MSTKLDLDGAASLLDAIAYHEELACKRRERAQRRAEAALAKAIREASGEPERAPTLWEQPERNGKGGNPWWAIWTCDGEHFIRPFYIALKDSLPRCSLCGRRLRRWYGPLPGARR